MFQAISLLEVGDGVEFAQTLLVATGLERMPAKSRVDTSLAQCQLQASMASWHELVNSDERNASFHEFGRMAEVGTVLGSKIHEFLDYF